MDNQRTMKYECYIETLQENVINVEMVLNHICQIENHEGVFDEKILKHDRIRAILDLELSLATLCILLRKMSENMFVVLPDELRKDLNSLIHSNRFEYLQDKQIIAYSKKGRESIDLEGLLNFCKHLL